MTPAEYEATSDVQAAMKHLRSDVQLQRAGGWGGFKQRLMKSLGVPEDQFTTWVVPMPYIYAFRRVVCGWRRRDCQNIIPK